MNEAERPERTVLVVDDNPEILSACGRLLEGQGYRVRAAASGEEAVERVLAERVHAILLDQRMPGMTGEQVVERIREIDHNVQIVLHTGHGASQPALATLERLDIQGWVGKDEGPERLLVWIKAALKSWDRLATIQRHRQGLRHILDASPDLQQLQPLPNLLDTVLQQMVTLLSGSGGLIAAINHGLLLTLEDNASVKLAAGAGRYSDALRFGTLPTGTASFVQRALAATDIVREPGRLALPLELRGQRLGAIYVETEMWHPDGNDLLMVYAHQVAIALENARLYEIATIDSLTGLYSRRHLFQRMREVIKTAGRQQGSLGLLVMDLDRFKAINDTWGHPAGDRVLASVGRSLRSVLRESDVAARTGGEEFAVLLTGVGPNEVSIVAERLRMAIDATPIVHEDVVIRVTTSIGAATLAPRPSLDADAADALGKDLYSTADQAVYEAKRAGGNRAMLAAGAVGKAA
ncbi:diguanylate cyclase [Myxococcota bacterium]|nr:diguanylate cyclase [Myxococcota bacterium]